MATPKFRRLADFPNRHSPDEITWAQGRRPERTYISKSFTFGIPNSRDYGQPARYVYKVFDEAGHVTPPDDCEIYVVNETPGGRKQIRLLVTRESGQVRDVWLQRVSKNTRSGKLEELLHLNRGQSERLIKLFRSLEHIPIEGEDGQRLDDEAIQELLQDPEALQEVYEEDPSRFRRAIEDDSSANDVVAVAHRREQVVKFRKLLTDDDFFERERRSVAGGGREKVWQTFLEENPWILGVALTGQLLMSWSDDKLEQVVAGFSVAEAGKRSDAFMRTVGGISSVVFAEIKHHRTDLLGGEYRSGCWAPSGEISGGVVQSQQTVHLATKDIGERLNVTDSDGADTDDFGYFLHPRSFLIAGHLDQLRGDSGGVHRSKYRSFEVYRRSLNSPEIITFDELLARAEWHVQTAERNRS